MPGSAGLAHRMYGLGILECAIEINAALHFLGVPYDSQVKPFVIGRLKDFAKNRITDLTHPSFKAHRNFLVLVLRPGLDMEVTPAVPVPIQYGGTTGCFAVVVDLDPE